MEHRDKLPAKMIARANISLWSILKNCIGKELSKITMPVVFNEPLSFLQRLTENVSYIDLVEKANESLDPLERMELVAAYAVACLSNNWLRMNKPFNPLLGETYEFEDKSKGFVAVAEQVLHHPPVSAYHVEGKNFVRYGSVNPKLKWWGKSIEIVPDGLITLSLKNHNETYIWSNPCGCLHNMIFGPVWLERYGKMEINCNQSDYKAVIDFKSAGWSGRDLNRLDGFIVNKKTKKNVKFIYGKWTDYLKSANIEDYEQYLKQNDQIFRAPERHEINQTVTNRNGTQSSNKLNNDLINSKNKLIEQPEDQLDNDDELSTEMPKSDSSNSLDIPNSKILWIAEPRPENSADYYNFTKFSFCLNELTEELEKKLPCTDSRFRPDIRLLELGEIDEAEEEKNRLEWKQRKLRWKNKTYSPLWFNLVKNDQGKDEWRFNQKYFERNFKDCPDIFQTQKGCHLCLAHKQLSV